MMKTFDCDYCGETHLDDATINPPILCERGPLGGERYCSQQCKHDASGGPVFDEARHEARQRGLTAL
jgi:hypothetical protein